MFGPPANLDSREPLIHVAGPDLVWFRSHRIGHSLIHFGTESANRWDAPDGAYGVLYLASDERCAFIESIGRSFLKTRFIPAVTLQSRALTRVRFRRRLRLIDMASSGGLARLGADGAMASGAGYCDSQRWSAALHRHRSKPDGIYYRSRFDPALTACAIFDHCKSVVDASGYQGSWATQQSLLGSILDHYGFGTDL